MQTETDTHRQTQMQTDRQTDRQTDVTRSPSFDYYSRRLSSQSANVSRALGAFLAFMHYENSCFTY